jgi:hypothetical protein
MTRLIIGALLLASGCAPPPALVPTMGEITSLFEKPACTPQAKPDPRRTLLYCTDCECFYVTPPHDHDPS